MSQFSYLLLVPVLILVTLWLHQWGSSKHEGLEPFFRLFWFSYIYGAPCDETVMVLPLRTSSDYKTRLYSLKNMELYLVKNLASQFSSIETTCPRLSRWCDFNIPHLMLSSSYRFRIHHYHNNILYRSSEYSLMNKDQGHYSWRSLYLLQPQRIK